eukprot:TRINITY_DN762_c0_g1_i4.p1 TRINITY_DN762_c0_g1~~TRINITY_DN762_c0_g1_i4.p1  ORF type:complete len:397 (+),score=95.18 TRINITY_DN762_c0_g1_i4:171-1361(+)
MMLQKTFKRTITTQCSLKSSFRCFSSDTKLKRTSLYDFHNNLGAKMVPFAGWEMPVQYSDGVLKEHVQCRTKAALFDVSHMQQLKITGRDRIPFIESLVVGDYATLSPLNSKLSVFTNEKGGIIDDTVITNAGDYLYIVVNAGCADKDIAHLNSALQKFKGDVKMDLIQDHSLIALQGPSAASILQSLVKEDLSNINFMTSHLMNVNGIPCRVTRCGYTGEDGFEISVPSDQAVKFAKKLLENSDVRPAGLGARDSLRLEAGLCLYGHDLNDTITPVEASLSWLISKRRREQGGFPGDKIIQDQLKDGVARKRVGLTITGAPAREGAQITNEKGEEIGVVTSGTLSPTSKQAIAMGYVQSEYSKIGTKVNTVVRGKTQPSVIAKMPWVPHNYITKK